MEKWIDVKDRLPENMGVVLVTIERRNGERYVEADVRYNEKFNSWEWAYEAGADYWEDVTEKVTHWMPYPKPALSGREEG